MTTIEARCLTCRNWLAPPPGARKPVGHCGLDGEIAHAGYRCDKFRFKLEVLPRILGMTEDELAWLQAHPEAPETRVIRKCFRAADRLDQHDFFREVLTKWRIWRRVNDNPPPVTTGE